MSITALSLFSTIAMVVTCVVGIVRNPPAMPHIGAFRGAGNRAHPLFNGSATTQTESYPFRFFIPDRAGNNQYFRFMITPRGRSFRAYLVTKPPFSAPLESFGLISDEDGRYYLDTGRITSAADCEEAAKSWANNIINRLVIPGNQ